MLDVRNVAVSRQRLGDHGMDRKVHTGRLRSLRPITVADPGFQSDLLADA